MRLTAILLGVLVVVFAGLFYVVAKPFPVTGKFLAAASQARLNGPPQPAAQAAQAAPAEVDCNLVVPPNPLSAQGLATPWVLSGKGMQRQNCKQSNPNGAAFVQGTIINPATGALSIYDPLVITDGTKPAAAPTVPTLPAGAVVGLFVGFDGNNLTLVGDGVAQGNCVNGLPGSIFGQVSFCNGQGFFAATNQAVAGGKLKVPALGTAKDGMPCPTTRDFSLVDQDQSDNVTTQYLLTAKGRTAQNTPANAAQLQGATVINNGSDNALLDRFVDPALGCTPFTVADVTDASGQSAAASQATNELQAAANQAAPIALVPALDPMVLNNGNPDLNKLNAYRVNVDQPAAQSLAGGSTTPYCRNLLNTGLPRIAGDKALTINGPSPVPATGNNLFNFLAARFQASFQAQPGFLMCTKLLNVQNPVTTTLDGNGVAIAAQINLHPAPLNGGAQQPPMQMKRHM